MAIAYKIDNGFLAGPVEVPEGRPAPAGHTFVPPPAVDAGKAAQFRSGRWVAVPLERKLMTDKAAAQASPEDKKAAEDRIDREASDFRAAYISNGVGQQTTYLRKEAEARDVRNGGAGPHPYLDAEATALDITTAELADKVIADAEIWDTVNTQIESLRRKAKTQVKAATLKSEIDAVFPIQWPQS